MIFGDNELPENADSIAYHHEDSYIRVDSMPELMQVQHPEYLKAAKYAGRSGTVWLSVLVCDSGTVQTAKVARSSRSEDLDNAAIQAAYHNKFKPAVRDGKPVAVWVMYKVEYHLRES